MTQNGLPIARPTPNTSQLSCESSCRWAVSDTVLGWGSRPLVFFARYLAGRLERPACSLASRRQVWCLLSAAIRLLHITRGVSFRVRGQSSPHRAKHCSWQRLSAGRARDHPVMEIVPNKALSLSLSLSLTESVAFGLWSLRVFGLWRVCFPPCR
jgi:hypothetical protein